MSQISKDTITVLRPASEAKAIAQNNSSTAELLNTAAVINYAANSGQTSCIVQQSLKPETIQDLINNNYIVERIGRADATRPVLIDWSKAVAKASAGTLDDINHNSLVYNKQGLSDFMYIELPPEAKQLTVKSIEQIQSTGAVLIDMSKVTKEGIWLKIDTSVLDTSAGKKIYKITFDSADSSIPALYFGYIIQDDAPNKSYVYMDISSEGC